MVNNKKTSFNIPKRNKRNIRKVNKTNKTDPFLAAEDHDPKMDFVFLGFPKHEFKYKGNRSSGGRSLGSDSGSHSKHNGAKHMPMDEDDDEEMQHLKLPLLPPLMALFNERNNREEAPDEYCTEIVDQLRQNNNSLIDEIKELRKEAKESSESMNKEMITAIKELQSELKKTLTEELPKIMKN